MRFVQALALAGSSVAFAEHKAFQEKYIIGCSTEQIATANSITDSFRTCAEELYERRGTRRRPETVLPLRFKPES